MENYTNKSWFDYGPEQYAFVCVPLMPSRSGRSPLEEPSESNFLAVPRDLSFHEFLRERQSYAIFHSTNTYVQYMLPSTSTWKHRSTCRNDK